MTQYLPGVMQGKDSHPGRLSEGSKPDEGGLKRGNLVNSSPMPWEERLTMMLRKYSNSAADLSVVVTA
ncbi:uncharacterized protein HMPREF1541_07594 [Cyphellophora europaea CBS 101466]|uniref:Uncharacterized protein n=1 Tax=Cyphellophora europaea (strain CBS 101466) TaxID=1220924 RepID=W2RN96_CYPE1|nr:uncharacterized protein HMPREF1541_07594 [Cyphellophora europaea CBS 101466]ETN37971.1 hypothetical protein HMPREF1541_07594 [Cyphellophora europaea CBS 101466]